MVVLENGNILVHHQVASKFENRTKFICNKEWDATWENGKVHQQKNEFAATYIAHVCVAAAKFTFRSMGEIPTKI